MSSSMIDRRMEHSNFTIGQIFGQEGRGGAAHSGNGSGSVVISET